jgi:hypothetical protein
MHFFSPPIRATCPAHLSLLDLIIVIILGEEYKGGISIYYGFYREHANTLHGENAEF